MTKFILSIIAFIFLIQSSYAQIIPDFEAKKAAMPAIRERLATQVMKKEPRRFAGKQKVLSFVEKLNDHGYFSDIKVSKKEAESTNWTTQGKVASKLERAFSRMRDIAWASRKKMISAPGIIKKLFKAIENYALLETLRPDLRRFHASCFAMPTLSANIYFILYNDISKNTSPETAKTEKMLQKIVFQAFTQPLREDVNKPYSVDQYRKNSRWVSGNFTYRRPFLCAAACNDPKMLETVWQVCNKAISPVSFNTLDTAFWSECFTADGAAWGHGNQSYAYGYGIDGALGILRNLKKFQGTPWPKNNLTEAKFRQLLAFADGMTWLQYRMRPCLTINGRHNLTAGANLGGRRISGYLENVLMLNPPQNIKEKIDKLKNELDQNLAINLHGARYFWNNDDMVMRGKDYYVFVNMISPRSIGPESVTKSFSELNYNLADGSTVLLRKGDEYDYSKGAWNFSVPPGTTSRKMKKLPATNIWRGFKSKHNFAGGISGVTGCCGFIFEKDEHETKKASLKPLYGVKAYKSYFMLDGIMVALGTGIRNLDPTKDGNIFTNLNQTALRTPLTYGIGTNIINTAKIPFEKEYDLSKIKQQLWGVQDGIGYIILPKYTNSHVIISAKNAKTNWKQLDRRNTKKTDLPKQIELFSISIDHGKEPNVRHGDSYAYIVMMECPAPKNVIELIKSKRIKIVSNGTKLQAIWDNKLKIAQMVIFSPKAVYNHASLKVKSLSPAVVQIIKLKNGEMQVSVADPTQNPKLKSITLIINGRKVDFKLPGKPFCGKTASLKLK